MQLPWLLTSPIEFPPTSAALQDPSGLLAAGGALTCDWLLAAYQKGIFPWFNEGDPILWWTPSPRMVLYPHQHHISRSLFKRLKKSDFQVTINQNFNAVIAACAAPRAQDQEPATWISPEMASAYQQLHQQGYAHSVEVWHHQQLIGGLYGIAIDRVFFGESMFSRATNGSKIAMAHLVEWLKRWHYKLIDCQIYNPHLSRLGAIEIDRLTFEQLLQQHGQRLCSHPDEWVPGDITLPTDHWIQLKQTL